MYLGIVWNQADSEQDAAAIRIKARIRAVFRNWIEAADTPGLFVIAQPSLAERVDTVYRQSRDRGAVLGRLFNRHDGSPCSELSLSEISANPESALRGKFWGAYVCFLKNPASGTISVLRSPGGEVPCQHVDVQGVHIYFARLPDVEAAASPRLRLNRHFFLGGLISGTFNPEETAYQEVSTLLPGARASHDAQGRKLDFFWNPLEITTQPLEMDQADIVEVTRETVQQCVQSWASYYGSVSLQLSGGLDSTIVAACMGRAASKPAVVCVNFFLNQATADERVFAREVADRWGFELLEVPTSGGTELDLSHVPYRTVIPSEIPAADSPWPEIWRKFSRLGVRGHFRGDGGDELFHRGGVLPDCVDFAYLHGLTPKLWKIAMSDARIDDASVWSMLMRSMKYGLLKQRFGTIDGHPKQTALFVREAAHDALNDKTHIHPLFREPLNVPPGKVIQSQSLLRFTCRVYPGPREFGAPPTIAPLIAEPLMELLLRTPLWVLRDGGKDRSVARRAFSDVIPRPILNRKYKGLYRAPVTERLARHIPQVRDLMLDGYLVREKIVSRSALEEVLIREAPGQGAPTALLGFVTVEKWVQQALSGRSDSAALERTA